MFSSETRFWVFFLLCVCLCVWIFNIWNIFLNSWEAGRALICLFPKIPTAAFQAMAGSPDHNFPMWVPGTQLLEPVLLSLALHQQEVRVGSWSQELNPCTPIQDADTSPSDLVCIRISNLTSVWLFLLIPRVNCEHHLLTNPYYSLVIQNVSFTFLIQFL